MSMIYEGNCTILRGATRATITAIMESPHLIDMEKLRADMAECVERTSMRDFSLKATRNRNQDFYRNFAKHGRDKRISADVFAGIVLALGKNPAEYVSGLQSATLPNATVLTSTFALLLDSVGIDPYESERAQKLAERFPNALRHVEALHSKAIGGEMVAPEEESPVHGEDRQ